MPLHSIKKTGKHLTPNQFKEFKQVNRIDEIGLKEVFKIQNYYIIGVDYLNNDVSKRLISKEIEKEIIFVRK